MFKVLVLTRADLRRDCLTINSDNIEHTHFRDCREEYRTSDLVIYIDGDNEKVLKCRTEFQPKKEIQIGDIVEPTNMNGLLRGGASGYLDAVVVSIEPFVLVSREPDMIWYNMEKKNYKFKEKASTQLLINCLHRLL